MDYAEAGGGVGLDRDGMESLWTMMATNQVTKAAGAAVTATVFSEAAELVWFGDSSGRLSSYTVPDFEPYSACLVDKIGKSRKSRD
jgi:hypothetical protein